MKTIIAYPQPLLVIIEPQANDAGEEVESLRRLLYRYYLCNTRFAEDGAERFSLEETTRHIEDWVNIHTHYPKLCGRCLYCRQGQYEGNP